MSFASDIIKSKRPASVDEVDLPRRQQFYPSPDDWRNEVIYFLLPDRFSDGKEQNYPLLDRSSAASIAAARPQNFRWDEWAQSGGERWQGGTLKGITSKLDYLDELGVTTLWVGPIFKQRGHLDTYHGYAIQDFLEVDPHFGSRQDLVALVTKAHRKGMRILLDIIFNHSGHNWDYKNGETDPQYKPWPGFYEKGQWLDANGDRSEVIREDGDGVWPTELRLDERYTRAGKGSLAGENIEDDHAEIKRSDFDGAMRDFNFDGAEGGITLTELARCYKYWIALTDCDGFRLDTLKHVSQEAARNFCGTIKEFAANLGKSNFFLVGEVGGPDANAGKYLDVLELNLNATLDIGPMRNVLRDVAKGLSAAHNYFDIVKQWDPILGSHRNSGPRHVTILDDHDHVSGSKTRFSSDAATDHQVVAGAAIQLFSLGIPCIYYGTEQAFAGPEKSAHEQYLPDYGGADKYLREIMFAADHPRAPGRRGLQKGSASIDSSLPAFGAFGTTGHHCFDQTSPVYRRIKSLVQVRQAYPVLRYGRQYLRDISNFGGPFVPSAAGELIAWSRMLDDEEAVCIVNGHGTESRGADITIDATLNEGGARTMQVIANSAQSIAGAGYAGTHPVGQPVEVQVRDGRHFVAIREVAPSEVLVLVNRSAS